MSAFADDWSVRTARLAGARPGQLRKIFASMHGDAGRQVVDSANYGERLLDAFSGNIHSVGRRSPGRVGGETALVDILITTEQLILVGLTARALKPVFTNLRYAEVNRLTGEHARGFLRKKFYVIRIDGEQGPLVLSGNSVDVSERGYYIMLRALREFRGAELY